jgi:hypothetical protein
VAGSRDIRAGRAAVELSLADKGFSAALAKAMKMLRGIGRLAKQAMAVAAGAAAGAAAAVALLTKRFAAVGDALDKMSKRTGVAVEDLSALSFAAQQSGTNVEGLERGLRGMARFVLNAERGLSTATDTLDALGMTLDQLNGLTPAQQFQALAQAIGAIVDPTRRAGLAMQVFGRAGSELLPLISGGGFAELVEQAERLNLSISGEQAAQAAILTDRLNELRSVLDRLGFSIGSVLAPLVSAFAESTATRVAAVVERMDRAAVLIRTVLVGALTKAVELGKNFALGLAIIETRIRTVAETLRSVFFTVVAQVSDAIYHGVTKQIAHAIRALSMIPQNAAFRGVADALEATHGVAQSRLEDIAQMDIGVAGRAAADARGATMVLNSWASRMQDAIVTAIGRNTATQPDMPTPVAEPDPNTEAAEQAAETIAEALGQGLRITQRQAEGGFNAAVLARQIGGRDPAQRTAKATERSADAVERIERAINTSTGLVFA